MGLPLNYRDEGPRGAPVVVLGSSLGTTLAMFDGQAAALAEDWRVIRVDLRGHGRSTAAERRFGIDDMAADIVDLLDNLSVDRFSYVGVSISGAVGQVLGIRERNRLDRLVICASAVRWPDPDVWRHRAERVRAEGTDFLVASRPNVWFSAAYAEREPQRVQQLLVNLQATNRDAYAACCDAIADFDARPHLASIAAPTLVVVGEHDPATPVDLATQVAAGIPGARLLVVPGAFHLLTDENSLELTDAIGRHLRGLPVGHEVEGVPGAPPPRRDAAGSPCAPGRPVGETAKNGE